MTDYHIGNFGVLLSYFPG